MGAKLYIKRQAGYPTGRRGLKRVFSSGVLQRLGNGESNNNIVKVPIAETSLIFDTKGVVAKLPDVVIIVSIGATVAEDNVVNGGVYPINDDKDTQIRAASDGRFKGICLTIRT